MKNTKAQKRFEHCVNLWSKYPHYRTSETSDRWGELKSVSAIKDSTLLYASLSIPSNYAKKTLSARPPRTSFSFSRTSIR